MKFIKLHQCGLELLVDLCNISEIHEESDNKSSLHFNFAVDSEQESITVDESIDEILELIKQGGA